MFSYKFDGILQAINYGHKLRPWCLSWVVYHMQDIICSRKFQYSTGIMRFFFGSTTDRKIRQCLFRFRISDQQPFDRPVAGDPLVPARFLSEFERSQDNPCPRNLTFCAKSAKNAYFVPKLSNTTEKLHFKRKIWELEMSDQKISQKMIKKVHVGSMNSWWLRHFMLKARLYFLF